MIKCQLDFNAAMIPDTAIYFASTAKRFGISDERSQLLCFLIESTLELRSRDLDDDTDLTIELTKHQTNIAVSITDSGIPYIPTEKQKKILNNGLVDGFVFEQLGTRGQRITFFIGLDGITEGDPPAKEQLQEKQDELLDSNFSCRLTTARDKDIIEVIRCIYSAWKYTYVNEDMYYLDYFKNAIRSGEFISVLAENEHHQIIGHSALQELKWFPGIFEMCGLIIKPFGRGLHVSELLQKALLHYGNEKGKEGLFADAVTTHPISQKILEKDNFTPCGLKMHLLSSDKMGDSGSRPDMAIAVRLFNKEKHHYGYLPEKCASFVKDIFDKEGVVFEDLSKEVPERLEEDIVSIISFNRDIPNKLIYIHVDRISLSYTLNTDWIRIPDDGAPVELITVYINLKDPLCPDLYDLLIRNGYIFSGCLPGSLKGDYIILQDLRGKPMDWDKPVLTPGFRKMVDRLRGIADTIM